MGPGEDVENAAASLKAASKVLPCVVSRSLIAFRPVEGEESVDAGTVAMATVDDEAAGWAQGEAGRDELTEDRPDSVSKPGDVTPDAPRGSGETVADNDALCVGELCRDTGSNDAHRSDKGVSDLLLSSSAIAQSALLISSADTFLHACGDLAPLLDGDEDSHLRMATLPT